MIVWRGWGWLVPVFWIGAVIVAVWAGHQAGVSNRHAFLLTGPASALAGALLLPLGRRLNARLPGPYHSFFFVRIEWWGLAFMALGAVLFVFGLVGLAT